METYLDNSATTKVCDAACQAAVDAMQQGYGNPSSLHKMGFAAEKTVTRAREQIAHALGCKAEQLLFTSGATESNNLALFGLTAAYPRLGKRIVTTAIEHPSVLEPCRKLEESGYTVIRLTPDCTGRFTPEAFADAVDEHTALVTFMLVNNELGSILDAPAICKAVKRKNPDTLIHIDAVQGFCKMPFSPVRIDADTVSLSGHKIYAPKGIGALYLKKGVRLHPRIWGGGQEKGLRSGTESVPLIAAFGEAVTATYPKLAERHSHYQALNRYLRAGLNELDGITLNSKESDAPYILNFSVKGIRSEIMLHYLEQREIYLSSGSACAKGQPSHVLTAFGCKRQIADTALRVSFSPDTDQAAIDRLLAGLREGIASLQKVGR